MTVDEARNRSVQKQVFDREALEKLAIHVLSELRDEMLRYLPSHDLDELQAMDIWQLTLPSQRKNTLLALYAETPVLNDLFDRAETRKALCTLDNLTMLAGEKGAPSVASNFADYFENGVNLEWSVLIEMQNVRLGKPLKSVLDKDGAVVVRQLNNDERQELGRLYVPSERLESLYFVVRTVAGDRYRAVKKARDKINKFIAPYYIHRVRNPDPWWRARTTRQIVSPVAFFSRASTLGMKHELWQLRTDAADLFLPESGIDQDWQDAVEQLTGAQGTADDELTELEEHLRLCVHWMFVAESEESAESAFLKHAIAWEALFPGDPSRRRGWYLILLSAWACVDDQFCIKTVFQAERLTARRNSLAHPETTCDPNRSLEQDLNNLQQSLSWALENAIRVWRRCKAGGTELYEWPKLLRRSFDSLCAKSFQADGDATVQLFLSDLKLLECDPEKENRLVLNRVGQGVRVEALVEKARECWNKETRASVRHLARALRVADEQDFPVNRYHVLLTLRERHKNMDRGDFEEGWSSAQTWEIAPTANEIENMLEKLEGDYGR